ncbi:hypothetical protein P168DRAFT_241480 [Aspergillus campestris IBT 28561]|uniref:Uncharacterized protein n=1 Tax=Aspergillus campestris (strain IBT 28561) TaxID=1392248 RepID=A0A2I1CVC8_ASPC2|nr:uncharacterized protein P168DRAFT_241480 [Aspergillus campestris IBT 28561]PKY01578.1 hypothetical protein P168DRAFT_241480 [Aspergillus campestris IBT 28561]
MAPVSNRASHFETVLHPESSKEWRSILQGIKLLYTRRQYKQCATHCFEILNNTNQLAHPVYKTYLHFYSAISHEEMGRCAHIYSSNKISLLRSALDSFVACTSALPAPIPTPTPTLDYDSSWCSLESSFTDPSFLSESSDSASPVGSLISSITDIIDGSIDCPADDPFLSDTDTWGSLGVETPSKLPRYVLTPSPLNVHKSVEHWDSSPPLKVPAKAQIPPPLPLKIRPSMADSDCYAKSQRQRSSLQMMHELALPDKRNAYAPASSTSSTSSIHKYNDIIEFLRAQIATSISDIHKVIDETTEAQKARRASKTIRRSASFWSFSPVEETTQSNMVSNDAGGTLWRETKEQRIARLRADGWRSVGLRSTSRGWKGTEYYKAFCASVLDEVCLDT